MSSDPTESVPAPSEQDQRLERIVNEYMESVAAGKQPDQQAYLRAHPDLAEALRGVFRTLGFIEAAGKALNAPLLQRGEQLGEFRIVREIGRGGMGVVYEAVQTSLDRRVALKVLPAEGLLTENALERFRREAHTAGRLHHTSIVPVYAVGEERGVCYYAMQFIEGRSLAHYLKTARETPRRLDRDHYRRVALWGRQAAEALAYAHGQRVIHRDIKPANLLLDQDGNVWIFDFGLARIEGSPAITQTGAIVGTVRYMSPEQARGGSDLDARSDIYSLGATLFELTTLRPAYDHESHARIIQGILHEDPPPLRQFAPGAPRDLEVIIDKCMRKEPDQRYRNAADLADDLRRFLAGDPIKARPMPLSFKVKRWLKRHRGIATGAAALVILGIMGTALTHKLRREEGRRALETAYSAIVFDQDFQRGGAELDRAAGLGVQAARLHLYRGLIPLLNQEPEAAIRHFEELQRHDPDSLEACYAIARARIDQGEFFDGQRLFEKEGRRKPADALGWFLRGYALSLHRPAEAIQCYDRALELQPNFVPAILERATYRGVRLLEEGRREELKPMLNDADAVVVFRPNSSTAYTRRAWSWLAAAAYAATQPDLRTQAPHWFQNCRDDLDQALALNNPPDSKTHNVRGAYLRCVGDFRGSAESYARSNELQLQQWHKVNAYLLHARAVALHAVGDLAAAMDVAEQASRAAPGFYAVLLHHAILLAEAGRLDDARAVCRRSLEEGAAHATGAFLSIAVMEFLGSAEEARLHIQTLSNRDAADFTFEHLEQPEQRLDADAPVVAYFEGRLDPAALLSSAGNLPGRKCEYAFLIALRELGSGRRETGLERLRNCLDTGVFIYIEHRLAHVFLERAKSDPRWPAWIDRAAEEPPR